MELIDKPLKSVWSKNSKVETLVRILDMYDLREI